MRKVLGAGMRAFGGCGAVTALAGVMCACNSNIAMIKQSLSGRQNGTTTPHLHQR